MELYLVNTNSYKLIYLPVSSFNDFLATLKQKEAQVSDNPDLEKLVCTKQQQKDLLHECIRVWTNGRIIPAKRKVDLQ